MPLLKEEQNEQEKSFSLKWYKVRNVVKEQFGQRPDINALLFIIGMNELGQVKDNWEKEEKQALMHIAVCRLLAYDNYYTFTGHDSDGWPHYMPNQALPPLPLKEQEALLKQRIVQYFEEQGLI